MEIKEKLINFLDQQKTIINKLEHDFPLKISQIYKEFDEKAQNLFATINQQLVSSKKKVSKFSKFCFSCIIQNFSSFKN